MSKRKNLNKRLYHATTQVISNSILQKGRINEIKTHMNPVYQGKKTTKEKPGSLGYGFYLFSDYNLACKFMQEKINGPSSILLIDINIPRKNMLDLTNPEVLKGYNRYIDKLSKEQVYEQRRKAFRNSPGGQSSFEGSLIDYFIHYIMPAVYKEETGRNLQVVCVRAFTTTQVGHSKGSFVANGIEYCLKNRHIIKNIKEDC